MRPWYERLGLRMPSFLANAVKTLSAREASSLRDEFIDAYLAYGDLADDALTRVTSKVTAEMGPAVIWSTMTRDEAGILADIAIARGRKSPVVAQSIRYFIIGNKYLKAGLIVGPRAWAMFERVAQNGGFSL